MGQVVDNWRQFLPEVRDGGAVPMARGQAQRRAFEMVAARADEVVAKLFMLMNSAQSELVQFRAANALLQRLLPEQLVVKGFSNNEDMIVHVLQWVRARDHANGLSPTYGAGGPTHLARAASRGELGPADGEKPSGGD